MGIVDDGEWMEFRRDVLEEECITVGEVIAHMVKCKEKAGKGKRVALSRSIASVLRCGGMDSLARDVLREDFVSGKGSGERGFETFRRHYLDLKASRVSRWGV